MKLNFFLFALIIVCFTKKAYSSQSMLKQGKEESTALNKISMYNHAYIHIFIFILKLFSF